ncbi:MAG: InlB B-repeat-containing protein [Clostridia bacterium]
MKKRITSIVLAISIIFTMVGATVIGQAATDVSRTGNVANPADWVKVSDVTRGGFEEADSVRGNIVGPTEQTWAVSASQIDDNSNHGGYPGAFVGIDNKSVITGTNTLKFHSAKKLLWGMVARHYFAKGGNTNIDADATALSFKIKTDKTVKMKMDFYDTKTPVATPDIFRIQNFDVVGSGDVQTIVVPYANFLKEGDNTKNVLTGISTGDKTAYNANLILRIEFEVVATDATTVFDVYLDDFQQVKPAPKTMYTIKAEASENGSVEKASQEIEKGKSVTIVATPSEGYDFEGWYKNNTKVENAPASYTFNATENATYVAKFKAKTPPVPVPETVTITAKVDGANGKVTPSTQTINKGDKVTLTATADSGYSFDGWYLNGKKIDGATSSYEVTATADAEYLAKFIKNAAPTPDPDPEEKPDPDGNKPNPDEGNKPKPDNGYKPGNGGNTNSGNGTQNTTPTTSDSTPIAILVSLILASGAVLTTLVIKRQKSKN